MEYSYELPSCTKAVEIYWAIKTACLPLGVGVNLSRDTTELLVLVVAKLVWLEVSSSWPFGNCRFKLSKYYLALD